MIRLLFLSLLVISCKGNTNKPENTHTVGYLAQAGQEKLDTLLMNVEDKIYNKFVQSLMSKSNKPLLKMASDLEEVNKVRRHNLVLYWRSYLQFYSSIYYLKTGDKKTAEKEIDKGIEWLDEMEGKNSEDYALLAMLQGFGIQFKGMKAMFISSAIKKNGKQAMAMDSLNLRAYYVYASNDFHTPEKYGGGKEAEKYLLKAISLSPQKVKNAYLPSWGKEQAYEMLIKLYIKKEKWDSAKKYFQEGTKDFPESYVIKQLAVKLVGK